MRFWNIYLDNLFRKIIHFLKSCLFGIGVTFWVSCIYKNKSSVLNGNSKPFRNFNHIPRSSHVPCPNRSDSPSKVRVLRQGGSRLSHNRTPPHGQPQTMSLPRYKFLTDHGHPPYFVSLCSNAFIYNPFT